MPVFRSADPFDEPFQDDIAQRLIFYPTWYELEDADYAALAESAASLGETSAFISLIEGYKGEHFEQWDHWLIDLHPRPYHYLGQLGWLTLMENAIYSVNGSWGILISHEQHAVIGGANLFMETFKRQAAGAEDQVQEFLSTWRNNRDQWRECKLDWLPGLLSHIYGPHHAKQLLAAAGL